MNTQTLTMRLMMMAEATVETNDWEVDHSDGDARLCDAIELLAENYPSEVRDAARQLVDAWVNLGKWYA
jgi:hypothetical protein